MRGQHHGNSNVKPPVAMQGAAIGLMRMPTMFVMLLRGLIHSLSGSRPVNLPRGVFIQHLDGIARRA